MEGCTRQCRGGKKVDEAAVDEWLEAAARAELGLTSDEEDEDEAPPDLHLHYAEGEGLSFLLQSWMAWRSRGVLPFAGGLADQPRVWARDVRKLDARYAPIMARLIEEKYPNRNVSGGGNELDRILGGDAPDWQSVYGSE